jgi:ribosomal protein L7/L12
VMADVVRLLDDNKRIWAIRCYREVHKCSLREAKDAVKALSKM